MKSGLGLIHGDGGGGIMAWDWGWGQDGRGSSRILTSHKVMWLTFGTPSSFSYYLGPWLEMSWGGEGSFYHWGGISRERGSCEFLTKGTKL